MAADPALVRRLQAGLKARGFDIGSAGPARDGIDGDPGNRTILACIALVEGRTGVETPAGAPGLTDPAPFFAVLKASGLFGRGLSLQQVEGINFKLAAMTEAKWSISWAATGFGTAYHETGGKMVPVREKGSGDGPDADPWDDYLQKYDTGRLAAMLGNTPEADGDGVFYAGRGDVQVTGLGNYKKLSTILGIDLVKNPELMLRPDVSAKAMIIGMERGIYTGKSLPSVLGTGRGRRSRDEYVRTRPIINGDSAKNGVKIANVCLVFEAALAAGGWN